MFYASIITIHLCWIFSVWKIYKANEFIDWASEQKDCCGVLKDRCDTLELNIKGYYGAARIAQVARVCLVVVSVLLTEV